MLAVKFVFWGALAGLAWTHAGYPLAVAAAARLRGRSVRRADRTPRVSVIVAAHDEEDVIGRRLENLLALDYPTESLDIVVASDASTDRTDEIAASFGPRVRLVRAPRAGKVAAQNVAVRETDAEIVAFSDANAAWAPDALRKLVRNFADPDVAYVFGRLNLRDADSDERGRIPAQGTHVRALLADHAARPHAPWAASRLLDRDLLAPAPALREWAAAHGRAGDERRTARRGVGLSRCAGGAGRPARGGRHGCGRRALLRTGDLG